MAKEIVTKIKLQIPGGQANPAPPIGPALGQHGVNIMDFCKKFNDQSKDRPGIILPVLLTVYKDKSFTFIIKTPPVAIALKMAAGLAKASSEPGRVMLGKVTREQVLEVARAKMVDLNTTKIESAVRIVEGTARSMGLEIIK
ncbi:MAG: 50S ribosomal protein L11 [Candidatus Omnitrophica bacterium]|nr:50S ribosomal protein L11 [Candidatus Omnitrophota bacterium]